jgi:hypothetical protein
MSELSNDEPIAGFWALAFLAIGFDLRLVEN